MAEVRLPVRQGFPTSLQERHDSIYCGQSKKSRMGNSGHIADSRKCLSDAPQKVCQKDYGAERMWLEWERGSELGNWEPTGAVSYTKEDS